jgi:hypothetical protein
VLVPELLTAFAAVPVEAAVPAFGALNIVKLSAPLRVKEILEPAPVTT